MQAIAAEIFLVVDRSCLQHTAFDARLQSCSLPLKLCLESDANTLLKTSLGLRELGITCDVGVGIDARSHATATTGRRAAQSICCDSNATVHARGYGQDGD